jgi:hypothetical protein
LSFAFFNNVGHFTDDSLFSHTCSSFTGEINQPPNGFPICPEQKQILVKKTSAENKDWGKKILDSPR